VPAHIGADAQPVGRLRPNPAPAGARKRALGCLNFHAGKLPFYRGRNVINWAIINGEREIGITAHFMDEGIDTGDILLQRTEPIGWTDTYGDVLARVVAAIPPLVEESVELVASADYQVQHQAACREPTSRARAGRRMARLVRHEREPP